MTVERKKKEPVVREVKWATLLSFLAAFTLALINALVNDSELLGGLPAWLQFIVVAGAPTVATFLGGYNSHRSVR